MSRMSERSALPKSARIRISRDISDQEKAHVDARKVRVKNCLQKFNINCSMDKVPNIALLGSGGGLRAMIALQGTLTALQEQGLLDSVMYLCGVSGSTWCMSYLYETKEWDKQLPNLESKLRKQLVNPSRDWNKIFNRLIESSKEDTYSLTDFWGNVVVYLMIHELDDHNLSEEQKCSERGIVPYPLYAAVDSKKVDDVANKTHSDVWFEFTPHEAGFFDPGAFVDMTLLGSMFENGELKTPKEEKKLTYLRGLWGSCIANWKENIRAIIEMIRKMIFGYGASSYRCRCSYCEVGLEVTKFLLHVMENRAEVMECKKHADIEKGLTKIIETLKDKGPSETYNFCCVLKKNYPTLDATERKRHFLKMTEILQLEFTAEKKLTVKHKEIKTIVSELERSKVTITVQESGCEFHPKHFGNGIWDIITFLAKTIDCIVTWKWGSISNHTYKCIDLKNKNLTDKTELHLIDAGIAINSAYPLVLRPERKVKLILSFDFSEGGPFETIKKASQYCKENKLPFPEIDAINWDKDKKTPEDCYIVRGNGGPTVMHFPLFNRKNCGGNMAEWHDRYSTFKISYKEEDIKDLLKAAKINVTNNVTKIRQELETAARS